MENEIKIKLVKMTPTQQKEYERLKKALKGIKKQ